MHTFIEECRSEGITYVAPWRPQPGKASQEEERPAEDQAEELVEGATGIATTSSDFGSMSLEEAAKLARSRMYHAIVVVVVL